MVDYFITCGKINYSQTRTDALRLAFEFAKANNKPIIKSCSTKKKAGFVWFRGFLKRNRAISLQRPEVTSLSRSTACNKSNISELFRRIVKEVHEKLGFEPQKLYNCHETGCTTLKKCSKVLKQNCQVRKGTSAGRETYGTLLCVLRFMQSETVYPHSSFVQEVKYNET